jgi:nitrogen fixation protein FixH
MVFFGFVVFFGIIIAVNGLMLTLALDTMPGTTTDSSYRASQRFNSDLAAARERAARGWNVDARVERNPTGIAAMTVSVREPEGAPVERIAVKARLMHPAHRVNDRIFDVTRSGTGLYAGTTEGVVAGAHDLVIEIDRDGEVLYRSRNRVMLP